MTASSLARICARCGIERKHMILIVLFLRAHPETSIVGGIWDFVRGHGPAAEAAGRAGKRSLPHPSLPPSWARGVETRQGLCPATDMRAVPAHKGEPGARVSAAA